MSRTTKAQLDNVLRALVAPMLVVIFVVVAAGCQAEPPTQFRFDGGTPTNMPYAGRATCIPPSGAPQDCPDGPSCGRNVEGPPDSRTINLRLCGTLDVVFTSGTVITKATSPGEADLAVHLGAALPAGVSVRVEGSKDGESYSIMGFLGSPATTQPNCKSTVSGDRVLVDASNCNHVSNVNFVRFSEERPGTSDVIIDAVEALSFKSRVP